MIRVSPFLFFGLGLVGLCVLVASGQEQIINADIEQQVDTYLRSEMQMDKIPGLSLTVMRDGKVILTRNLGFADVHGKKPVTSETAFEIGSLTKQFAPGNRQCRCKA